MPWYTPTPGIRTALRKHMLRVDMRIYPGDTSSLNPNDVTSTLKSLITAAIIKGLDVIGIVTPSSPATGWQAHQIAEQNNLDIWVLPGEEYVCADKFHLIVYLLKEAMPLGLTVDKAIAHARKQGGYVMAVNVTKRQAQHLNKLKDTESAPNAVEIYNAVSGGYLDVFVDYARFVSSSAKTAREIETSNAYTLIHRKDLEATGLLPEGEGAEYVPNYLQRDEQADPQNNQMNQQQQVENGS